MAKKRAAFKTTQKRPQSTQRKRPTATRKKPARKTAARKPNTKKLQTKPKAGGSVKKTLSYEQRQEYVLKLKAAMHKPNDNDDYDKLVNEISRLPRADVVEIAGGVAFKMAPSTTKKKALERIRSMREYSNSAKRMVDTNRGKSAAGAEEAGSKYTVSDLKAATSNNLKFTAILEDMAKHMSVGGIAQLYKKLFGREPHLPSKPTRKQVIDAIQSQRRRGVNFDTASVMTSQKVNPDFSMSSLAPDKEEALFGKPTPEKLAKKSNSLTSKIASLEAKLTHLEARKQNFISKFKSNRNRFLQRADRLNEQAEDFQKQASNTRNAKKRAVRQARADKFKAHTKAMKLKGHTMNEMINGYRKKFDKQIAQTQKQLEKIKARKSGIDKTRGVSGARTVEEAGKANLKYHGTLNQRLFDGEVVRPEVMSVLTKIAKEYKKFLNIPELKVIDVMFKGSNANYNYHKKSDIDLHLLVPAKLPSEIEEKIAMKNYMWRKQRSHVSVKGYEVEVGVSYKGQPGTSDAKYSLRYNKWISKPVYSKPKINRNEVNKIAKVWRNKIKTGIKNNDAPALFKTLGDMLKRRRYVLNESGMENAEYHPENLAFKFLRDEGWIDKLAAAGNRMTAEKMSLSDDPLWRRILRRVELLIAAPKKPETEKFEQNNDRKIIFGEDPVLEQAKSIRRAKPQYHKFLNPEIFDNDDRMRPEVASKILQVVKKFKMFLRVKNMAIKDVIVEGSITNYNYTEDSDIDVHVLVRPMNEDDEHKVSLGQQLWGKKYEDIKIKGYPLGVSVVTQRLASQGAYSLRTNSWLEKPKYAPPNVDNAAINKLAKEWRGILEKAIRSGDMKKIKAAKNFVSGERVKSFAPGALPEGTAPEFSIPNLAFKKLRATGIIDDIRRLVERNVVEELSLEPAKPWRRALNKLAARIKLMQKRNTYTRPDSTPLNNSQDKELYSEREQQMEHATASALEIAASEYSPWERSKLLSIELAKSKKGVLDAIVKGLKKSDVLKKPTPDGGGYQLRCSTDPKHRRAIKKGIAAIIVRTTGMKPIVFGVTKKGAGTSTSVFLLGSDETGYAALKAIFNAEGVYLEQATSKSLLTKAKAIAAKQREKSKENANFQEEARAPSKATVRAQENSKKLLGQLGFNGKAKLVTRKSGWSVAVEDGGETASISWNNKSKNFSLYLVNKKGVRLLVGIADNLREIQQKGRHAKMKSVASVEGTVKAKKKTTANFQEEAFVLEAITIILGLLVVNHASDVIPVMRTKRGITYLRKAVAASSMKPADKREVFDLINQVSESGSYGGGKRNRYKDGDLMFPRAKTARLVIRKIAKKYPDFVKGLDINKLKGKKSAFKDTSSATNPYYVLFTKEGGSWQVNFGDYDKNVVIQERKDLMDGYNEIKDWVIGEFTNSPKTGGTPDTVIFAFQKELTKDNGKKSERVGKARVITVAG